MPRDTHSFNGYTIDVGYGHFSDEERQQVIEFWVAEGAIQQREKAERRSAELVGIVRNEAGDITGVNTVQLTTLQGHAGQYFYYRMFIRQRDRVNGLFRQATRAAREHLTKFASDRSAGVFMVAENRKLGGPAIRRLLTQAGWLPIGVDGRGLDVWLYRFNK